MTKSREDPLAELQAFMRPGVEVDPTRNVVGLVESTTRRQDDLRDAEARHSREIGDLRAAFAEKLRVAEADRINAIRAVDVNAVQQAASVSATQATTLAAQVATSAETLRTQVAAAATAATVALAAALEPIQKDIADLRRAQYEAQGVKAQSTESSEGNRSYVGLAIAAMVGLATVLLGIAGIVITVLLKP